MRFLRNKKLAAVVTVVAAMTSVSVWLALPNANAITNVTWSAGSVVVANGSNLTVNVTNQTNTPKGAIIFVRKFDGTLLNPVANTNQISNLAADQSTGRAYACSSGPCSFSVKVTTTSTQVLPSASYPGFDAGAMGLSAGDFTVKVVKS